jgi:hypothetical protein
MPVRSDNLQRPLGLPLSREVGDRLLSPLPGHTYFPYRLLGMLAHHHPLEAHLSFPVGQLNAETCLEHRRIVLPHAGPVCVLGLYHMDLFVGR